ncbi:MAG: hypothetical protein JXR60_08790 [Bacteroidales bacterium]|nr:hypothetical protein [Bacteroidales bacterium]
MKRVIFTILLFVSFLFAFSQNQVGYVEIKGKIKDGNKSLGNTTVEVFVGGTKSNSIKSETNGKFILKLDFDKIYVLEFSKDGYVSKKVSFDTHVKEKEYVWPYPFTIELFKMVNGLNIEALKDPVTKIAYSDEEGDFVFDIPYTNSMKGKINAILDQSKQLELKAYDIKIAEADAKFKERDYKAAIPLYEQAIDINPYTDYPDKQIMICESKLVSLESDQLDYKNAIANADASFKQKQYESAKKNYEKASGIFPHEAYPKDKITEINALLANQDATALQKKYDDIIKQADALFAKKDYLNAKEGYKAALNVKPAEEYPKGRIADIDATLAQLEKDKGLNQSYQEKIDEGDRLMKKMEYELAQNAYNAALKIKANEQYPKDQLALIDEKMKSMAEDRAYADKIRDADAMLAAKNYELALNNYSEALALKPAESYPKNKINEINQLLAQQADNEKKEQQYSSLIAKGDEQLSKLALIAAKEAYNQALQIKPSQKYPQDKIKEIDQLLADKNAKEQQDKAYADAIKRADAFMDKQSLIEAKSAYQSALTIKSEETYPKNKIKEIDQILANQQAVADQKKAYDKAIVDADKQLANKNLEQAKQLYLEASSIKPNEQYPKDKISEIDQALKSLAAKSKLEQDYQQKISIADKAYNEKDWTSAKTAYVEASTLKPEEAYPKERISAIDGIIADVAKQKTLEEQYQKAISQADQQFAAKDYQSAKSNYSSALKLKPSEGYPKEKIAVIDQILSELANKAEKDKMYIDYIASADQSFGSKDYEAAKSNYQLALKVKPQESYPQTKINEIEVILGNLAEQARKDKEYQSKLEKADALFAKKSYSDAKLNYQQALSIKPNEAKPKEKISEIDHLLADQLAQEQKESQYKALIDKADKAFKAEQWNQAKTDYTQALALKQSDTYPQSQITIIDNKLKSIADLKQKDEAYTAALNRADHAFKDKSYASAKTDYQEALKLKPNEQYPKDQLKLVESGLAELAKQKELDAKYQSAITKADGLLATKEYGEAKLIYQEASTMKPNESYPKSKIKEIDLALKEIADLEADKAAKEKTYNDKIAEGDRLLAKREYQIAKSAYLEALKIKPDQKYPQDKIAEIEAQMAEMEKDRLYASKLKEGSDFVVQKEYEKAIKSYQEALVIKPNETFPQEKIKTIEGMIAEQAAKDKMMADYKQALDKANDAFDKKDYPNAKTLYESAIQINSTAQFPKDRLKQVEMFLAQMADKANKEEADKAIKAKYDALIQKADQSFKKEEYLSAKSDYQAALKLIPQQSYPMDKIKEIDKILAKEAEDIPSEIDFNNEEDKEKFISEMAKKYGEGIHEENYSSASGKKVRRVIVVKDGLADEYREVKQPWGATYYFKNGKSVARSIFFTETQK